MLVWERACLIFVWKTAKSADKNSRQNGIHSTNCSFWNKCQHSYSACSFLAAGFLANFMPIINFHASMHMPRERLPDVHYNYTQTFRVSVLKIHVKRFYTLEWGFSPQLFVHLWNKVKCIAYKFASAHVSRWNWSVALTKPTQIWPSYRFNYHDVRDNLCWTMKILDWYSCKIM